MTEPEPRFAHIDTVAWQEVKAQLHGDRRVSIREKYLDWSPSMLVLYASYDPGMLVERHGHASDHVVFVLDGMVRVGDVECRAGTSVVLPQGAVFGPIEAGPEGALLFEIMAGDPRAMPADREGFDALCAARGITPLPNPPIEAPPWFGDRTD